MTTSERSSTRTVTSRALSLRSTLNLTWGSDESSGVVKASKSRLLTVLLRHSLASIALKRMTWPLPLALTRTSATTLWKKGTCPRGSRAFSAVQILLKSRESWPSQATSGSTRSMARLRQKLMQLWTLWSRIKFKRTPRSSKSTTALTRLARTLMEISFL